MQWVYRLRCVVTHATIASVVFVYAKQCRETHATIASVVGVYAKLRLGSGGMRERSIYLYCLAVTPLIEAIHTHMCALIQTSHAHARICPPCTCTNTTAKIKCRTSGSTASYRLDLLYENIFISQHISYSHSSLPVSQALVVGKL